MKTYVYALISLTFSFMFLLGCGQSNSGLSSAETDWETTPYETVNELDNITMTIKEGTISETGLTVTLKNDSDKHCIYGESFSLEKKIGDYWYQVPVVLEENFGFNSIGYDLAASTEDEWTVDWEWLYGSLDAGEYRIIKDILDFREAGDYDEYILSSEFTIDS